MTSPECKHPRGAVLVLVLMVVAILALVSVGISLMVRGEVAAATAGRRGQQARAAAMSGIHRAMALLANRRGDLQARWDNPDVFRAQPVVEDSGEGWYFTVYAYNPDDPGSVRYGLEDEAGKINLNTATREMLLALPGMTEELADCLLDYRDADDRPRDQGAEQPYYDQLPRPYLIKNGPLATLEELLLVKGFTGSVVFGEDANRNGLLEPNEDDGDENFPPDDSDGQLDRGLWAVATTLTHEPDVDNSGAGRINVNTDPPQRLLQAGFPADTVAFVAAARQAGITFTDPSELLGMTIQVNDPRRAGRKMTLSSGVDAGNLALVMDKLTAGAVSLGGQQTLIGRVNLNSAPKAVLSALPGLTEQAAQEIVDLRDELDPADRATTAWIYTRNVVSEEVFKQVAPLLTARSFQFRVRSFGYSPQAGRFCVLEAVIDLASGAPRITYLRELTRLGPPLPVEAEQ